MPYQTIPTAGQYGIVADAAAQELPPNGWSDGDNMRFANGYAERHGGEKSVFTAPSITPYGLTAYSTAISRFWVHYGLTKAFVDDGTTRTEITRVAPYTGAIDDRWTGSSFNGVLIATNGVDLPQFWGGNVVNDFADLTAWDATWRCAVMRPFKNYLIALDVTKGATRYASMVKWSDTADPGTLPASWDATDPATLAGENDLAETADILIDALPLGDTFIIYKERSMYAMQPSGDAFVWRFTRIPGEFGMLARGCGAATPKGHVVLTAGDVVLHQGNSPQSILDGRMREWLFDRLDQTNWRRSFVVANTNKSEVWICFPESGQASCTRALTWNWQDNTFGTRQLSNVTAADFGVALFGTDTWASDSAAWDTDVTSWDQSPFAATRANLLLTTTAPKIIAAELSNDFDGASISAFLERRDIAIAGDTDRVKLVTGIRPRIDAQTGTVVNIQIGATMDVEVDPVYSTAVPYTVGSTLKADTFASGRFHSVKFSSSGAMPWRIKSFDLEYQSQGRF